MDDGNMKLVLALVTCSLIIGCGVPDPLPDTTSAAPCLSTSNATTQQQTTTSGELTSSSGAPTTAGSTGGTGDTSSGSGGSDPCGGCGDDELCINDTCTPWPVPGELALCTASVPRPGHPWGPCDDDETCVSGQAECRTFLAGDVCVPKDACGQGECAPAGCVGGYATVCLAPCIVSDDCPYENMVCESFELGAICLWPHR